MKLYNPLGSSLYIVVSSKLAVVAVGPELIRREGGESGDGLMSFGLLTWTKVEFPRPN